MPGTNSYIIGKARSTNGSSYFLGKVETVKDGVVYGVREKNSHIKSLRAGFEIPKRDVVVDLGTDPHPGKVYGQEVTNRLRGRKIHDFYGDVCFFYKPTSEVGNKLWAAFDESARILQKLKLPEPENSVWEIVSTECKSRWAGSYTHSRKEGRPHQFMIRPEAVPITVGDMVYVILHEYAHWLHANLATGKKLNAKWIRVFNTSIRVQTIERSHSQALLRDLLKGEDPPSAFKGQLDEDDRNAFTWILRSIKADHAVSAHELDVLFESGYREDIEALWPKVVLNKKNLNPVVSEYATTNYRELFAEAFAFHLCKRKLPEQVTRLVEKTISYCKAAAGN